MRDRSAMHPRSALRICTGLLAALVLALAPTADAHAAGLRGVLDPAFGDGGLAMTNFGLESAAGFGAIVASGQPTIAGYVTDDHERPALARLQADGTPDEGFGEAGLTWTDVGELGPPDSAIFTALTTDTNDRIVAAGYWGYGDGDGEDFDAAIVARYEPDGTLDPTFGEQGIATVSIADLATASDIVVDDQGRIVVAGQARSSRDDYTSSMLVFRLDAAGELDSSFGDGGYSFPFGNDRRNSTRASSLAIDGRGRIVVAGSKLVDFGPYRMAIARLRRSGALDPRFGQKGRRLLYRGNVEGQALDLALLPNGGVVVAGCSGTNLYSARPQARFTVARLDQRGNPLARFGRGGGRAYDVGEPSPSHCATSILRDRNGFLVGGTGGNHKHADLTVLSISARGRLRSSFGNDGAATLDLPQSTWLSEIAHDDHGLIAAGYVDADNRHHRKLLVARFH